MAVSRRRFLWITGATALTSGLGAADYGREIGSNDLLVQRKTVSLPCLPASLDGLRVVLMSDFHLYPFTTLPLIERAIAMANSLRPDLVLLAGDYVYGDAESIFDLAPALDRLNARLGVFAILGNTDHSANPRTVLTGLRRTSIKLLMNLGVSLSVGGGALYLTGIDSVFAGRPDPIAAFAGRRHEKAAIALVHEPDYIQHLAERVPGLLQLSGHSHGGQVRVPGLPPLILPPWGRMYYEGLYQVVAGSQVYTTRGIGVVGVPMRVNCPPEVTELTLSPGEPPKTVAQS